MLRRGPTRVQTPRPAFPRAAQVIQMDSYSGVVSSAPAGQANLEPNVIRRAFQHYSILPASGRSPRVSPSLSYMAHRSACQKGKEPNG